MTDDIFTVAVPEEEMEAPQGFTPIPSGEYRTTFQPGAELASNNNGWVGLRLPFLGFEAIKGDGSFPTLALRAQFTVEHGNEKAVQIGRQAIVGAARALGLAEQTTTDEGKTAWKLTATSTEELIDQLQAVAGAEVGVYIKSGPRKPRADNSHLKDDGTPWPDSEIKRVFALED